MPVYLIVSVLFLCLTFFSFFSMAVEMAVGGGRSVAVLWLIPFFCSLLGTICAAVLEERSGSALF